MAAAVPLSQQAAVLGVNQDQSQQGGGGLSPNDLGALIAAGGLI
jgi:hypothetical protein